MDPCWINSKFCHEILDEKLYEERVVVAGHALLAGGGGQTVRAGVVTLVLPPRLPAHRYNSVTPSCLIPVSVTDITEGPDVIIDIPRSKIVPMEGFRIFNST